MPAILFPVTSSRLLIGKIAVYPHMANIFAKLNVFSREELMEKISSNISDRPACPAVMSEIGLGDSEQGENISL
ncbi:MAG: hypothetical protein ACM3YE_10905 [Bacteroidota bacterium]